MFYSVRSVRGWLVFGVGCLAMQGVLWADPSGLRSDDFNSCTLDTTKWTTVDPLGGGNVALTGMGTQDAVATVSVPAGASHDVWSDGNHAVSLMQPANNTDFEVRVKLDTLMNAGYQMQGLLVEQDAGQFLRYDFGYDGKQAFLFSATIAGGSATIRGSRSVSNVAPFWLGLKRTGATWTLTYSTNGTSWSSLATYSFTMTVTRVGFFAGNWGPTQAPAFTARLDYFLNTADPFTVEDGPVAGVTLTTSVTGQGTITVNPLKPTYTCGETVTLTAVPATGWAFANWTGDLSGTQAVQTLPMTVPRTVQANFTLVSNPLQITNVAVSPGLNSATINWTTDRLANSAVSFGLTTGYELGQVQDPSYVTSHITTLSGLSSQTTYHYSVRSVDQNGQSASTADATFTTLAAGAVLSDDFNNFNVNPAVWTLVDPLQDAIFSMVGTNTTNARLQIALPAGGEHIAWTNGISVPWLKQQRANTNFDVQAKFDSALTKAYQVQGILIQESSSKFIRVDFSYDGKNQYFYAGAIQGNAVTMFAYKSVSGNSPWYLRVVRAGNTWTVSYTTNPASWTTGASFTYAMNVTAIGPYAGNEGSPAPAFNGLVDFFFNSAAPISPEDGAQVTDVLPPNLYSIRTVPGSTSVQVLWSTDEPCTCSVAYGLTTSYELGSQADPSSGQTHAVTVSGLVPATTYNFQARCTDGRGNASLSGNLVETTGGTGPVGPTVTLWYGDVQEFGRIGMPQPVVNILGNVSSSRGVLSLQYELNGGPPVSLSMGADKMRLAGAGDFNADIPFSQLQSGANQLIITARDTNGAVTRKTIDVIDSSGPVWPLPYSISWSGLTNINDVAQVTDGLWTVEGSPIRPVYMAYDRLVAIGDVSWQTYQITVPVTVHALNPNGYASPSFGPGVGVLLRWPGHSNDGHQPWEGVYPLGGISMYRWTNQYQRFEIFGNGGVILKSSTTGEKLLFGITYIFKARVQNASNQARYTFKWWRSGQTEPAGWLLTGNQSLSSDPGRGCLLLLAHEADVSFGNVLVEP